MSNAGKRIDICHVDRLLVERVAYEVWGRASAMSGTVFEKEWDKAADAISSHRGWITYGQFGSLYWALNKRTDLQEEFKKQVFSRIEAKNILESLGT